MIHKYILISIYCLIAISNIKAQCWQTVYSGGNGNAFTDVFFSSDSVGWVSEYISGTGVYKTIDNGISWEPNDFEGLDQGFSVFFLDENIGWVGHSSRTIFKTEDGGETWTEYDFSMDDLTPPYDIEFLDPDTGYMVTSYARAFRSRDGGETWDIVFENEDWQLATLDFVNAQEGWLAGSISSEGPTRILHTTDAGETWEEQLAAPSSGSGAFGSNVDLHFLDDQTGWFVNRTNLIYKTEDGGETWESYPIAQEGNAFAMRIFFINDTLGWAPSTDNAAIYVTIDGGLSWHPQSTDPYFNFGNTSIFMTSQDNGAAVYWPLIKHYLGGPAACNIQLISPSPSSTTTALQPEIKWHKVPGCVDGYRLSVGLIPGGTEIIGPLDVGLDTSYMMPFALLEDMDYYISIVPYNHVHGLATNCGEPFAFTATTCPPTTLVDTSFCDPPFVWVDTSFEEAGTYLFEYLTSLGCDSVVVLALSQEDDIYTVIDTALVIGQPYNEVVYESDTILTEIYAASNGCDSIVQVQLTIITTALEPAFISQWQVFPNPVSFGLWFHFFSRIATSARLVIYDAQGRELFATELLVQVGANKYLVEAIRDWPVGLYWYRLETRGGSLSGKVLKE
ncbi:MAG: hypothetical protein DHS20C18_47890 [Saprospiraceae bacterium]|nr:MAG: hypothetical protein DHS20C18_47890 [Saprospiraceae bacterium]